MFVWDLRHAAALTGVKSVVPASFYRNVIECDLIVVAVPVRQGWLFVRRLAGSGLRIVSVERHSAEGALQVGNEGRAIVLALRWVDVVVANGNQHTGWLTAFGFCVLDLRWRQDRAKRIASRSKGNPIAFEASYQLAAVELTTATVLSTVRYGEIITCLACRNETLGRVPDRKVEHSRPSCILHAMTARSLIRLR